MKSKYIDFKYTKWKNHKNGGSLSLKRDVTATRIQKNMIL